MEFEKYLSYEPLSGDITWSVNKARAKAGDLAGTVTKFGYRRIKLNQSFYFAHKIAWYLHYGYWPKEVDHINRDRLDNRIENLREVTRRQNVQNASTFNGGASFHKHSGLWRARIYKDKYISLGYFKTESEAQDAYNVEAAKYG